MTESLRRRNSLSIWAHIRGRYWSMVSQHRRHLFVTPCSIYDDPPSFPVPSSTDVVFLVYTVHIIVEVSLKCYLMYPEVSASPPWTHHLSHQCFHYNPKKTRGRQTKGQKRRGNIRTMVRRGTVRKVQDGGRKKIMYKEENQERFFPLESFSLQLSPPPPTVSFLA